MGGGACYNKADLEKRRSNMSWYWWLVIGLAVVLIIPVKLKILKALRKKSQEKESDYE